VRADAFRTGARGEPARFFAGARRVVAFAPRAGFLGGVFFVRAAGRAPAGFRAGLAGARRAAAFFAAAFDGERRAVGFFAAAFDGERRTVAGRVIRAASVGTGGGVGRAAGASTRAAAAGTAVRVSRCPARQAATVSAPMP
jgi:hypothetical protein